MLNAPYNAIGGAPRRFRSEVEHFALQKRCVEVFCRSRKSVGGVVTEQLKVPTRLLPFLLLEMLFRSVRSIFRHQRIVFVTHDPISCLGIASASLLFPKRTRTYLVVHGPMSLEQNWLSTGFLRKRLFRFLLATIERVSYRLANQLFPVSEYEMRYLKVRYHVSDSKMRLIRNGIDITRFVQRPDNLTRRELGIRTHDIVITNIGHLYTYRGLSTLFRAFQMARTMTKNPIRLVVVGEGSLQNTSTYKFEVESLGISSAVVFTGDRSDIPRILSVSDIYAERFSQSVDGIGIAIMEAMAAGLPVVTGTDWISSQLLTNKKDCLLVEKESDRAVAEALVELVENVDLRRKLGSAAQATALRLFSIESMLENCDKAYFSAAFLGGR